MNNTQNQAIIMNDSDEAATLRTNLSGWVSRHGRFFGLGEQGERTARWDGCTHVRCACGGIVEKGWTLCETCRQKQDTARYQACNRKPWDGKTPLCIFESDRYFWSEEELLEYCDENGLTPKSLRLMICEPVYGRDVDADHFQDELPEDSELPEDIQEAVDALNVAIRAHGPLSWRQGEYTVDWTATNKEEAGL